MKRMHIHVAVDNIEKSLGFYSALFGQEPTKIKSDYAKWMLDDPRINFAISTHSGKQGLDHLGLQVEEDQELADVRERLKTADMAIFDEGETVCCYAKSDKSWVQDPSGIAWEAYQTMAESELFREPLKAQQKSEGSVEQATNCCTPKQQSNSCCG